MPRNKEHLPGVTKPDSGTTEETVGSTSLNFPKPIEVVKLPTMGKFYPDGHPLKNKDYVEIKHMTANEEEILTNKSLLQQGLALNKMVQSVLIDKSINVDSLYTGDKNAIVVAARITAYGPDYEVSIECPECDHKTKNKFVLSDIEPKNVNLEEISDNGMFTVVLQGTGEIVVLKLLTGYDEAELKARASSKKKLGLKESPVRDFLKSIIVSIGGNNGREYIESYVDQILAKHSIYLRGESARLTPDLDLNQGFECLACGDFCKVAIPFGRSFFWPLS